MSLKNSEGQKARWKKLSANERSEKMRSLSRKRWGKMNDDERRAYSLKLVRARRKNNAKYIQKL